MPFVVPPSQCEPIHRPISLDPGRPAHLLSNCIQCPRPLDAIPPHARTTTSRPSHDRLHLSRSCRGESHGSRRLQLCDRIDQKSLKSHHRRHTDQHLARPARRGRDHLRQPSSPDPPPMHQTPHAHAQRPSSLHHALRHVNARPVPLHLPRHRGFCSLHHHGLQRRPLSLHRSSRMVPVRLRGRSHGSVHLLDQLGASRSPTP